MIKLAPICIQFNNFFIYIHINLKIFNHIDVKHDANVVPADFNDTKPSSNTKVHFDLLRIFCGYGHIRFWLLCSSVTLNETESQCHSN